jgi:hypothetical protein
LLEALTKKSLIHASALFTRKNADRECRIGRVKTSAEPLALWVDDVDEVARLSASLQTRDSLRINPRVACPERTNVTWPNANLCHARTLTKEPASRAIHRCFRSLTVTVDKSQLH